MKPILSVRELSWRLNTPVETLRAIAGDVKSHYRSWSEKDEKTGKVRIFRAPKPELMRIQKRINTHILKDFPLDDSAHGGIKGRSPRTNASRHLGRPIVITMDLRSFFPKVRHGIVHQMFAQDLGFGRDVASLLTRLTTLDAQLPQGAPTSPMIANMLLTLAVDSTVSAQARDGQLDNSRFVDDFGFSGADPRPLINTTAKALSRKRLPIWRKPADPALKSKLKIMPRHRPQLVTGLTVNSPSGPSVPVKYRDAVRSAIHQLSKLPTGPVREAAERSIGGKIRHVSGFNPGAGRRLTKYLGDRSGNADEK